MLVTGRMVKIKAVFILAVVLTAMSCDQKVANNHRSARNAVIATPVPTASVPKNGDYPGRGKVLKINNELGSVELDHEEIVGVMPKMTMEFFVSDKAMLRKIAVGDTVDFSLRYKDGQETIISISKSK